MSEHDTTILGDIENFYERARIVAHKVMDYTIQFIFSPLVNFVDTTPRPQDTTDQQMSDDEWRYPKM
ncbi:MAG TPA: hypothetical protein VLE69_01780 [Candidatus Saccharimonadales bacterium]|nr:hypothetical protein [Candidatus Saccharimonadales bacterium]